MQRNQHDLLGEGQADIKPSIDDSNRLTDGTDVNPTTIRWK